MSSDGGADFLSDVPVNEIKVVTNLTGGNILSPSE